MVLVSTEQKYRTVEGLDLLLLLHSVLVSSVDVQKCRCNIEAAVADRQ